MTLHVTISRLLTTTALVATACATPPASEIGTGPGADLALTLKAERVCRNAGYQPNTPELAACTQQLLLRVGAPPPRPRDRVVVCEPAQPGVFACADADN